MVFSRDSARAVVLLDLVNYQSFAYFTMIWHHKSSLSYQSSQLCFLPTEHLLNVAVVGPVCFHSHV